MPYKNKSDQKKYHAQYDVAYYQRNKARRKVQCAALRKSKRIFLEEIKAALKCQICGENESVCLDFHHRSSAKKDFIIGNAVRMGYSKNRILAEIAKCDVLCANCHRKQHAGII